MSDPDSWTTGRNRILVVGAGYAGLAAAIDLSRRLGAAAQLTLANPHPYHLLKPRLPEAAVRGTDVAVPLGPLVHPRGIRLVVDEVVGLDLEARRAHLRGCELSYDTLVLATGAVPDYRGIPGLEEEALPLKSAEHARRIFERLQEQDVHSGPRRVAIVGGGFAGIEVAFELARWSHEVRSSQKIAVHLLEAGERLLPWSPARLSRWAETPLRQNGVIIQPRTTVERLERGVLHLSTGERLAAHTTLWMGGVAASTPLQPGQAETGRLGRVIVDDTLRLPGRTDVYVVGDAGRACDPATGKEAPLTADLAEQQGRYLARAIQIRAQGLEPAAFQPRVVPESRSMSRNLELAAMRLRTAKGGAAARRLKEQLGRLHVLRLHGLGLPTAPTRAR